MTVRDEAITACGAAFADWDNPPDIDAVLDVLIADPVLLRRLADEPDPPWRNAPPDREGWWLMVSPRTTTPYVFRMRANTNTTGFVKDQWWFGPLPAVPKSAGS